MLNLIGDGITKGAKKAIQENSGDLLRKTISDVIADSGIDTATKGFGKDLLNGIRKKVYNSSGKDAQAIVDAFPKLFRTDFGTDANDIIKAMKNDGGAVLSGFARYGGVDAGKGTRRIGISRSSFDNAFKNQQNSFLANPLGELVGSPRTKELYENGAFMNAQDALDKVRDTILNYHIGQNTVDELSNIYGADDFTSKLLERIARNGNDNTINEFKMAIGPRDVTHISDLNDQNVRQLIDDKLVKLPNGDTIRIPANSLLGDDFSEFAEELYKNAGPAGEITKNGYKFTGTPLENVNSREDIYNKLVQVYGPDKTKEIMAYYGGDIGKSKNSARNSFLGQLLTGNDVQAPLVMYHSVDSDKLSKMLDLAEETSSDYAIPNPSVQVVDPAKNIGGRYGDIVLLGNKSIPGGVNKYSMLPDPNSKYNLYSRDIYSPRKPNIVYSKGVPTIEGTRKLASPQNISDYMTKQGAKAVESNWSTPASLAATTSKRFNSPLDAIENADLLKNAGYLDVDFAKWDSEVSDYVNELLDKFMAEHPGENPYSYADYILSELQDAMAGKKPWNDPYGINTTERGKEIVADLVSKAKQLPTAYFEGKSTRAVPLKEFGGAVLPKGYNNQRILKALEDSGIEIKGYYDPENYEESFQNILLGLRNADRFKTPYLLGLATLLGGGAIMGSNKKEEN